MFFFKCIFLIALCSIIDQTVGLIRVPHLEDNEILKTEAVIRSTVNNLFSSLDLENKNRTQLLNYSLIHNYFSSLTLKDNYNLKKIAELTRVSDKNIDNKTITYTVLINEILNEDSETNEFKESRGKVEGGDRHFTYLVDDYLKQLKNFKELYWSQSNQTDIFNDILNGSTFNVNDTNKNGVADNEFWDPSELFSVDRRIFLGTRARINQFPFMAVVQIHGQFHCAGSIISSDLVITAASCLQLAWNNRFYREKPSFLSVRVGCNFYAADGEEISVLEVYFHPKYKPKTLRNNLAIMRLSRLLNFKHTHKRVKKIRLDTAHKPLSMITPGVTVVGWGAMTTSNVIGDPWTNKIHFAVLDIYPLPDCKNIYTKEYVARTNFCAGFISKGIGACNRDLGGPGIVNGTLTGVISFGSPQCGTPDSPTVFTKLGYYTDWIESIMEQPVPRQRVKTTTTLDLMDVWTVNTTHTKGEDTTHKIDTNKKNVRIVEIGKPTEGKILENNINTKDPWTLNIERPTTGKTVLDKDAWVTEAGEFDADVGFATTTPYIHNEAKDSKQYRDALKTIFNSAEIDRYVEILLEEQEGTGSKSKQLDDQEYQNTLSEEGVDLTTTKDLIFDIETSSHTKKNKRIRTTKKSKLHTVKETNREYKVDGLSAEITPKVTKKVKFSVPHKDHIVYDHENINIEKDNSKIDETGKELQDQLEKLLQYVNVEGNNYKDKTVDEETLNFVSNLDTDLLSLLLESDEKTNEKDNSMADS